RRGYGRTWKRLAGGRGPQRRTKTVATLLWRGLRLNLEVVKPPQAVRPRGRNRPMHHALRTSLLGALRTLDPNGGTEVAIAAKGATQIIPIVFTIGGDPVKAGVVASLNRPGGNVTGTSFLTVGLGTKRLELLYELVPRASVIAVLVQTGSAIAEEQLSDLQQAANALRLRLVVLAVSGDADLELAFAKVALEGAGALYVSAGAFFTSRRDKLAALAAQHRIPTMYPRQEHVAAGGLISYAPNVAQSYHRAGMYAG